MARAVKAASKEREGRLVEVDLLKLEVQRLRAALGRCAALRCAEQCALVVLMPEAAEGWVCAPCVVAQGGAVALLSACLS